LDPDIKKIPPSILKFSEPLFKFNKAIVNATHDFVCTYKPQIAYYSAIGAEKELEQTIEYIHINYPDIPVILDAKRSDIRPTAEMYAKEAFERYQADAVTVNPFLGFDSIKPFTDWHEKGVIILCKTSNPGSTDFQDIMINGKPAYLFITEKAIREWNYNHNILLVVGATYPSQMRDIRKIAGNITFLVPGIGAQGGSISDVIMNGLRHDGLGLIISSSRGIIHASNSENFAEMARQTALKTVNEIRVAISLQNIAEG
jgi:orotidine-5'-phosphate decarboxylase